MYVFGNKSKQALKGVHPNLVKVLETAIIDSPIDFTINEGIRSLSTQQKYYAQGRTTKGPVITNADGIRIKSNHQIKTDGYGYAVDLYPYVNGEIKYDDEKDLKIIADHIKVVAKKLKISVAWGGDWNNLIDKPHFELK